MLVVTARCYFRNVFNVLKVMSIVSDKGENVWDHFTHYHKDNISDHRDGDIACDSYYKYKQDVALIKSIGVS